MSYAMKHRMRSRIFILIAGIVFVGIGVFSEAIAAPKAELWPRWQTHDENSRQTIDHGVWGGLLKRYITPGPNDVNLFRYGAVTNADKQKLNGYIDHLEKIPVSQLNRREQQAYWVNLYNALTVKVVLDHYPVKSIRDIDISPGFFADGPWGKKLITIENEKISLHDIEHRILRPIWRDARIHYAVNCASIGCPNLQDKAFTAENIESLLDLGARQFINSSRGVAIKGNEITISKIYDWFQSDFGDSEKKVIRHLMKFAKPGLKKQLQSINAIDGFAYDWSLNDVRK
jgi:hypothetical protein